MRLGGLISGADTETLISALLELERTRIYRQENQQAELEQKQKAWRDVRNVLQRLQEKLDPLRFPMLFRSRKVTVSDDSVVAVTAEPGAAQTSYSIRVIQLAQNHMVASKTVDQDARLETAGGFQIGDNPDHVVTVEAGDTLSTLASKINQLNAGVTAHVVSAGNNKYRLVLTSTKSGQAHRIVLTNVEGSTVLQDLGLQDQQGQFVNVISEAQDAVIELNGVEEHKSATNVFSNILPGISITVKKASSEAVSVTVEADPIKVVQAVKDWVSAFNAAQDQLKALSAYDAEKKTAGTLTGDSLVRSIQFKLRDLLSQQVNVDGQPETLRLLSQVGIGYGAYGTADYGKLVVDEAKLKAALERDPEAVARLFNAETGPIGEMNAYLKTLLDSQEGPFKVREESLTRQINRIKETIERLEYQLELREQTLRRQFQQMEEMMARLKSQGNYFMMQLFGGMFQSE